MDGTSKGLLLITHLVLTLLLTGRVRANWMYLGMVSASLSTPEEEAPTSCEGVSGLVNQQRQVCQAHPSAIQAVGSGARRGILECQRQFRHERWNCSTRHSDESVFGPTLDRGSRETAFIYAITSAGAVHAVVQACSAGNLTDCSCDRSRQGQKAEEGWKWGGCSDNVRYGTLFARQFVDAPDRSGRKRKDVRTMMNLHNNHAGRLAVSKMMEQKCRCHGVSGSCELKTCWRTLPSFGQVGNQLKRKYLQSVQVSGKVNGRQLRRRGKRKAPLRKEDLVYIHTSPNYCLEDPTRNIPGTVGRVCNKTAPAREAESCQLLCCGRGYNTQVQILRDRCHCKFHWCCYVTCKLCETVVEVYTCK